MNAGHTNPKRQRGTLSERFALGCLVLLAGCEEEPREATLKQQAAAVRAGESDRILIETAEIGDEDLREITGLQNLRELLLDNPRCRFSAGGIRQLIGLPKLEHLRIRGGGVDDEALAHLAGIESLVILNLPQATIGNDSLAELKRLPRLTQLRFSSPRVTDAGMKTLAELPALTQLHLINVPITDKGLDELAKIKRLESLYLDGGQFTDFAVEKLFRDRPDLHVHLNQSHHDLDPHKHEH
jgi:hypothetical protein